MSTNLQSFGFIGRIKLSLLLSPVTDKYGHPRRSHESIQEAIKLLEAKVKLKPKKFVFRLALSDFYLSLGNYVKAIQAFKQCCRLRPRDSRSVYGLASAYRKLTEAKYLEHPNIEEIRESVLSKIFTESAMRSMSILVSFDPMKSQKALEELELTINQAAEKSLKLFEHVLTLDINLDDAKMIKHSLSVMYAEFPHLKKE